MHRTRRYVVAALAVAGALAVGGCGSDAQPDDPTAEDTEDIVSEPSEPTQSSSAPPEAARASIADLAAMLGVAAGDIEVVGVEEVTWRDGSLGCAEPGTMYTQALVDGQRLVLSVAGAEYEYHSGGSRAPFYCETPTE